MCRDRLSVEIFICFKDNFNTLVLRYICICANCKTLNVRSIEARNVRYFTFVFSMKGMISVILILVVAMYQEILSCTEQGFIGLLRGNQKSMF